MDDVIKINTKIEPDWNSKCPFCKIEFLLEWDHVPWATCTRCGYTTKAEGRIALPTYTNALVEKRTVSEILYINSPTFCTDSKKISYDRVSYLLPHPIELTITKWYDPNVKVWVEQMYEYEKGRSQVCIDCDELEIHSGWESHEFPTTEQEALEVLASSFANYYYMFTSWSFGELKRYHGDYQRTPDKLRSLWSFYRLVKEAV